MEKLPKAVVFDNVPTGVRLRGRLDTLHYDACAIAGIRGGGQPFWDLALLELALTGFKHEPTIARLINDCGVDPAVGGGQAFALAAVRGDVGMLKLLIDGLAKKTKGEPEDVDVNDDRFTRLCKRIHQQLKENPSCACQRPDPAVLDAALGSMISKKG